MDRAALRLAVRDELQRNAKAGGPIRDSLSIAHSIADALARSDVSALRDLVREEAVKLGINVT